MQPCCRAAAWLRACESWGAIMPEQRDGHLPVRSRLAVALLKSGLAFDAIWMLTFLAFVGRAVLAIL